MPALQEDADVFDSHPVSQLGQNSIQLVDPSLIRAIAITTHAIAVHRSHIVTRRYNDPMREGLERVVRSSGRYVPNPKTNTNVNRIPNSPQVNSRWGRKTAPTALWDREWTLAMAAIGLDSSEEIPRILRNSTRTTAVWAIIATAHHRTSQVSCTTWSMRQNIRLGV